MKIKLMLMLLTLCSGCVVENGDYKTTYSPCKAAPIYRSIRDGFGGWHEVDIAKVPIYKNY